jgi:hypothetical protein
MTNNELSEKRQMETKANDDLANNLRALTDNYTAFMSKAITDLNPPQIDTTWN